MNCDYFLIILCNNTIRDMEGEACFAVIWLCYSIVYCWRCCKCSLSTRGYSLWDQLMTRNCSLVKIRIRNQEHQVIRSFITTLSCIFKSWCCVSSKGYCGTICSKIFTASISISCFLCRSSLDALFQIILNTSSKCTIISTQVDNLYTVVGNILIETDINLSTHVLERNNHVLLFRICSLNTCIHIL